MPWGCLDAAAKAATIAAKGRRPHLGAVPCLLPLPPWWWGQGRRELRTRGGQSGGARRRGRAKRAVRRRSAPGAPLGCKANCTKYLFCERSASRPRRLRKTGCFVQIAGGESRSRAAVMRPGSGARMPAALHGQSPERRPPGADEGRRPWRSFPLLGPGCGADRLSPLQNVCLLVCNPDASLYGTSDVPLWHI